MSKPETKTTKWYDHTITFTIREFIGLMALYAVALILIQGAIK